MKSWMLWVQRVFNRVGGRPKLPDIYDEKFQMAMQGEPREPSLIAEFDTSATAYSDLEPSQIEGSVGRAPSIDITGVRILVVENDERRRKAMLLLLEELGAVNPLCAPDGQSALTILGTHRRNPVHVLITDLNMPGMDGIEFIHQLGEAHAAVSIVFVSAAKSGVLKGVEKVAEAYGIALLGVLHNPVTRKQLAQVLAGYALANEAESRRTAAEPYSPDQIAQALSKQEFEPFFQPKVNLQTGAISGFEALVRWRRPGFGIILPGSFIEALEKSGQIDELTYAMLDKSVAACSQWHKLGIDCGVSINFSVLTLSQPDCAQRVLGIVKEHGVDPAQVTIEMTESSADASELKTVLANLSRLRINGYGLSIDDYGTGYSSMDRLVRVAFTELKIDQSFIAEAHTNASAMAILQSSIGVANMLQLVSVAEGIETKAQWDLLRGTGCELAQGYFISRPVEASAVPIMALEWLRRIQTGDVPTIDIILNP